MATRYQVVYWRDIPAQVICQKDGKRNACELAQRFQQTIDRIAMAEAATSEDDYLATWQKSEWKEYNGELGEAILAITSELEIAYPPERLSELEMSQGHERCQSAGETA